MSHATPVVAYAMGGLGEYVTDAGGGRVVPVDVEALAAAAAELHEDRAIWQALSEQRSRRRRASGTRPRSYAERIEADLSSASRRRHEGVVNARTSPRHGRRGLRRLDRRADACSTAGDTCASSTRWQWETGARVAQLREREGFEFVAGDVRDATRARSRSEGVDAVVHLAAIVGDPACARDPDARPRVNLDATTRAPRGERGSRRRAVRLRVDVQQLRQDGRRRRASRPRSGSFGRSRSTPRRRSRPSSRCSPPQRVPGSRPPASASPPSTASRRRMRFDLTVNEFTRDALVARRARRLRRGVLAAVRARPRRGARRGHRPRRAGGAGRAARCSTSATRTRTSARRISSRCCSRGCPDTKVERVAQTEDPRDYRVSFDKIRSRLGFSIDDDVSAGNRRGARAPALRGGRRSVRGRVPQLIAVAATGSRRRAPAPVRPRRPSSGARRYSSSDDRASDRYAGVAEHALDELGVLLGTGFAVEEPAVDAVAHDRRQILRPGSPAPAPRGPRPRTRTMAGALRPGREQEKMGLEEEVSKELSPFRGRLVDESERRANGGTSGSGGPGTDDVDLRREALPRSAVSRPPARAARPCVRTPRR